MRILTKGFWSAPAAAPGSSVATAPMRLGWCALLAAGLLGSSAGVQADTTLPEAIAPQPLVKALTAFAHQTGLQLVYVSTIASEQWSKGARAGQSATDALTELLDGTGLTFKFLNERAVRIFASGVAGTVAPRHDTQRGLTSSGSLDEIVVNTRRDAERLNIEYVQSVPGSITVLGGETLAAQKLEQLIDYAPYVPGMNTAPSGAPGQTFVTIRGFGPLTEASRRFGSHRQRSVGLCRRLAT